MKKSSSKILKEQDFNSPGRSSGYVINSDDDPTSAQKISGIDCIIQASYVNGKITGTLSCSRNRKLFKFEMNPCNHSKKANIDVKSELIRLYF